MTQKLQRSSENRGFHAMGTVWRFQTTSMMKGRGGMGFAREKYIGLFCLGRVAKYPDFRGRSPRYGCVRWFIQTRNRRSSEKRS